MLLSQLKLIIVVNLLSDKIFNFPSISKRGSIIGGRTFRKPPYFVPSKPQTDQFVGRDDGLLEQQKQDIDMVKQRINSEV